jgi:hypothetical protein
VQPAASFAAVEAHEVEKVAIAAEPYDTREKQAIFRVDYLSHGVLPIRLIVTNNGNRPISLAEARILFLTAAGDTIQAAEPGCRAADDPQGARGRQDSAARPAARYQAQAQGQQYGDRAGLRHLRVPGSGGRAAHHPRRLPLLRRLRTRPSACQGAKLHLRKLRDADGKELFYFEIPFDKYLKSKSSQMN